MIRGRVVHGDAVARKMGYPTANISVTPEETKLTPGVYAAWAMVDGHKYQSALVVQYSPAKVEAHLIDYAGSDFYDAEITVDPVEKVSEIERLVLSDLIKKVDRDVAIVREILTSG